MSAERAMVLRPAATLSRRGLFGAVAGLFASRVLPKVPEPVRRVGAVAVADLGAILKKLYPAGLGEYLNDSVYSVTRVVEP